MSSPAVSVVIASYNHTDYLREAIESVMGQTCPDWELLVADDGSGEATRSYLEGLVDPRVRIIWREHTGNPSRVRNAAIEQARGQYVAFLDSDDRWMPEKLSVQLAGLHSRPECRWSYTYFRRIDESGREIFDSRTARWAPHSGWIVEQLLTFDAIVTTPSVMVETSLLREVGGFDEDFVYCGDYDLWIRLAMQSPVCVEPAPLCWIRAHPYSHTAPRIEVYRYWDRLYQKVSRTVPGGRLRSLSRRRRAAQPINMAVLFAGQGRPVRALAALIRGSTYGWLHGAWWRAFGKALLRPLIPAPVLARYRRSRP